MSTRCLCLNLSYEPLGFLPQDRAVCLIYEKKVELIERAEGVYHSPSGYTIPVPLVVRLLRYIKVPRELNESITPRALFARDDFTCQYCGKHQSQLTGKKNRLTIDHIKPKSKDGPHHWENVVTACYFCNIRKRDRTPLQANMKLNYKYKNRSPRKPSEVIFYWGGKCTPEQEKWINIYYKKDD